MKTRKLGRSGPTSSAIGLGCMRMSESRSAEDRADALQTIAQAVEAGVTLIDTGDFYGMGHNELLVAEALRTLDRDALTISVKFGALRGPDGGWLGHAAGPAFAKTSCAYSLTRLGVDHIDIYRPARLDHDVPIEETVGAIADLVKAGYVRHIGLSEVSAETLRRAHAVHPISDLQIEYSLVARGIEDGILQACRELGVAITAYAVLSRGLISGHYAAPEAGQRDNRVVFPRFRGEALEHNLGVVERMRRFAEARGASVAQVAIAWVMAQGEDIFPVLGPRRPAQLAESLAGAD